MYSEEVLRQLPCYHCVHCVECKDMKRGSFTQRKCALTNRWGSMNKSFNCTKFENKQGQGSTEEVNGYRIRKDQGEDFRTVNQWAEAGYRVKPGAKGTEMYASRMAAMHDARRFIYYLPEQVEKTPKSNNEKTCRTCCVRDGRYCCVAGDFVKADQTCSEWMSRNS